MHLSTLFLLQSFSTYLPDKQGLPSNDYLIILLIAFVAITIGLLWYNLHKTKKEYKYINTLYCKFFNNPNYGVLLYNITDKYIVDMSQYLPDVLGYAKEELIIMKPEEFVIIEIDENIEEKSDATYNRAYVRANGESVSINVSRMFFENNNKEFLMFVLKSNSGNNNQERARPKSQNTSENPIERVNKSKDHKLILVAEDYDNSYILTKAMLENSFDIVRAYNGEEAVEMACSIKPDIILMNIQMPIVNGFEATRILREQGVDIPIIAFTAGLEDGDEEVMAYKGFNDHVVKPISRQELMNVITMNLKHT